MGGEQEFVATAVATITAPDNEETTEESNN
jgi:hypothetical protein